MMPIMDENLEDILSFTKDLCRKVGGQLIVRQKRIEGLKISVKKAQGITSTADLEAEEEIIKSIKKRFPTHSILAEESAYKQYENDREAFSKFKEEKYCWIIDPLDGTNNFLNTFDYFAISIAFVSFGLPLVGVVYRPVTDECFSAIRGKGAKHMAALKVRDHDGEGEGGITLNKSENNKELKEAMIVSSFNCIGNDHFSREFMRMSSLILSTRGVRCLGSLALDLCYLAQGTWDGIWAQRGLPWDIAAGGLICQESGVKLTDYNNQEFDPFCHSLIAARLPLFNHFVKYFSGP